jgi:hypothetical protein
MGTHRIKLTFMNKKLLVITAFILAAAAARLLPHAPNFTPLGAIALFAGAYISNRLLAFIIPILAMILSDALMGFAGWDFPEQIITVYGSFALITLLGMNMRNDKSVLRIGASSVAASVLFFVVTNFMVWMSGFYATPALYATNFSGLVSCYVAAIPFFTPTAAADLFYSSVLFGAFYLVQVNVPKLVQE